MNPGPYDPQLMLLLFSGATLIIVLFAIFLVYVLVLHRNKQNRALLEKQQMRQEHQQDLIDEQERVLETVSVLVHDDIGQPVHLMSTHLNYINSLATDQEQRSVIEETIRMCNKLIMQTKHISYMLNNDYIKVHGLEPLLEQELQRLELNHQITGKFIGNHLEGSLDADERLIIFRIAQEAFQNIIRHSGAQHVTVLMEECMDTFQLKIIDNGMGFPKERIGSMSGLGLNNMRNRARLLKGALTIESIPGKGTCVTLKVNTDKQLNHDTL